MKTILSPAHKFGLQRGTVKLVAHNPKWAEYFRNEKELLSRILAENVPGVEKVVDHLVWFEPETGMYLEAPQKE